MCASAGGGIKTISAEQLLRLELEKASERAQVTVMEEEEDEEELVCQEEERNPKHQNL